MATDSIMGLFQTPEQYQMAQREAVASQLAQEAQMDPFAKAQYLAGMSGYGLGKLAGGIMGAEDPMLQRQAQRRAMIQQVNMADPASLVQAIRASAADPELAAFFMGKYKELTGIQKEQSVIEKNKAWEAAKTDSEKKRNLLSDVEQALAEGKAVDPADLNRARLAWAQETKPRMFQDPTTGTIQTVPGVDVGLFPNLGKTLTGASSAAPNARVAGVVETSASREAAQTQAETAKEAVATVQNAINKVDEAAKLYSESKTAGGFGQVLASVPMTDARSLANLTSNIKAAFSVEEIAKLKAQSKTGATGFGSLAVKELETIQNAVTALDPADKKFPEQLKTIRESFDRWKKLMEQRSARAEAKVAGTSPDMAPKKSAMSGKNPQLQPLTFEQKVQRTMADPANKGKTQAEIEAALRAAGH